MHAELSPAEACTIAKHFLIAAIWADAPEGTKPRPTVAANMAAQDCAREFVLSIGLPIFRATLAAYEDAGLHVDCCGEACAAFGHDLYLTLAGHGVGFWDRKALSKSSYRGMSLGDRLTAYCAESNYDGVHGLEFYRGWVYFRKTKGLS